MPYQDECLGLLLMQKGRFRAFIVSDQGKEVTLYRLYDHDTCFFTATCIMNDIQFEIQIEVEAESQVLVLPTGIYDQLMKESIEIANYTNQLIASRFSDVMWSLEQILFKNMDSRIAGYLLEQSNHGANLELKLTHEAIARDLGTAREVVSRMLAYFRSEHILELARGMVRLLDVERLQQIAD